MPGRVTRIYLRPSARTPVKQVEQALAIAGAGVGGDHAGGGPRQITLIDAASWADACRDLGLPLDPGARRANVVLDGVELASALKKYLRIGPCLIEVVGETRPCKLMDDAAQGLRNALSPECRGGVYGRILEGGLIEVGAPAEILDFQAAD